MDPVMFSLFATAMAPKLVAIGILVLAAVLTGVIVAVTNKTFSWLKLADFARTIVAPKVGGWLILELMAFGITPEVTPDVSAILTTSLSGLATIVYGTVFVSLLANVIANLGEMGVWPTLPQTLRKE